MGVDADSADGQLSPTPDSTDVEAENLGLDEPSGIEPQTEDAVGADASWPRTVSSSGSFD